MIQFLLGLTSGNEWPYLLWSGFIGAIEGLGFFGACYAAYKRMQCHVDGCYRIGRHPAGELYTVCRLHHPDVPDKVTVEHIHEHLRKQ